MRILLTADPELPVPPRLYGGIERIIDVLVRQLALRGHEVGLCAHPESTSPAAKLFPWPAGTSRGRTQTLTNMQALRRAVRDFRPDLLHSFSRLAYLAPLLRSRLPKVMSYQRRPSLRTTSWASWLAGGTLQFTGCSEHICRIGRAGGGTWTPIHNCVELDVYDFQTRVAEDAPLVFLSRIERIKGAHTAIEIARRSGVRLIIAGNRVESGEGAEYWSRAIEPRLGDGVEFMGPVDDVGKNALLGSARAMLVPIEWDEPFGIVFAEALACGTPVISRPRGALPEIVLPGQHGFLIETVEDGVRAVQQLPDISRAACRERADRCFSADAVTSQYEQLYESALTAARPRGAGSARS